VSKLAAAGVHDTEFFLSKSRFLALNSKFEESNLFPANCVISSWRHPQKWKLRQVEQCSKPATESIRRKLETPARGYKLKESE
jgi:hypothetical protein